MMEGRDEAESCALTRVADGTDVDFGELTKELVAAFVSLGGDVQLMTEVIDLKRDERLGFGELCGFAAEMAAFSMFFLDF